MGILSPEESLEENISICKKYLERILALNDGDCLVTFRLTKTPFGSFWAFGEG